MKMRILGTIEGNKIIMDDPSQNTRSELALPAFIPNEIKDITSKDTSQTTSSDSSISTLHSEEHEADENDHTIVSFGSGSLYHVNESLFTITSSSASISELFHEIESLNWQNALNHLELYPNDAKVWEKINVRSSSSQTERLPLHHACLKLRMKEHDKKSAIKLIIKLIDLFPEGCRMRETRHGCLPLHLLAYASSYNKTKLIRGNSGKSLMVGLLEEDIEEELMDLMKKMIDIFPRAAKIDSEGGRLPLHMAISGKASPKVFQLLLNTYPSAARHRTRDMNLPLHLTATWGISSGDVPIALLKAYPDAALGQNRYGRTPLEEAIFIAGDVGRENQVDLLRVIRKHPTFWLTPQGRGITSFEHFVEIIEKHNENKTIPPLYKLIKERDWNGLLDRLDQFSEEAQFFISISSRSGRSIRYTPLHYACEFDPPLDVIQTLIALYPPALARRSVPGGFLPIHLACTHSSPTSISYIFQKYPKALAAKDELGNLPIHLLCYSPQSTNVIVHELLSHSPSSIFATNKAGSTPLDIVSRLHPRGKAEVIACLKEFIFIQEGGESEDEEKKELVWI